MHAFRSLRSLRRPAATDPHAAPPPAGGAGATGARWSLATGQSFCHRAGGQVLLAPNFSGTVARPCYADPAHPGCRFIDVTESVGHKFVF
jgi:hypothetical protein